MAAKYGPVTALTPLRLLDDLQLYRFKPGDLKSAEGYGFKPGAVTVTSRGVEITLAPIGH